MSAACIAVRIRGRSGALERVVALIRRRALPVRRFSVAESDEGDLELLLRVDPAPDAVERIRVELLELYDVLEAEALEAAPAATRELILARIRTSGGGAPPEIGRRIAEDRDGAILEITGAPDEVEAALARLREERLITGIVRSGEIAVPGGRSNTPRSKE